MNTYKSKILIIDSSENNLVIDDLVFLLCSDCVSIGHEIVNQTRVSSGIPMDRPEGSIADDVQGLTGTVQLINDVFRFICRIGEDMRNSIEKGVLNS